MRRKIGFEDNVLEVATDLTQPISRCSDRRLLKVKRSNVDWLDLRDGKLPMKVI